MIDRVLIGLARFLVGGHADWIGAMPDTRQRIYFANHGSHLDTLLLWSALPKDLRTITHPVAARDYWDTGVVKRAVATHGLNAVFVERTGKSPDGDALAPLRHVLDDGHSLILFPEGTRTNERVPGPFKSGLYRLALDFPGVELIPTYLDNPGRALPKGAFLPVPITCSVRFGAALARIQEEDKAQFLERARTAVTELAPSKFEERAS